MKVGRGSVRGVRFEDFFLESVKNPIIIDQNYCEVRGACEELVTKLTSYNPFMILIKLPRIEISNLYLSVLLQPTGVHISDVSFKNFYGTSSTNIAINLNCSRSVPCTGILLKSVYLRSAIVGQNVTSSCRNAYGIAFGLVRPSPCIQF